MTLDLNALAVESFETDPGTAELHRGLLITNNVLVCAAGEDDNYLLAPTPPYNTCGCATR